jgi:hypothetical protein
MAVASINEDLSHFLPFTLLKILQQPEVNIFKWQMIKSHPYQRKILHLCRNEAVL